MKQIVRTPEERVREDRADGICDRFVDAIVTGHLGRGAKNVPLGEDLEEYLKREVA